MSDEQPRPPAASPAPPQSTAPGERGVFDRIFPGPSRVDPRLPQRLEAIQRAAERRGEAARQRATRAQERSGGIDAQTAPSAERLDHLVDAVHEQTDVMRALLDADIAIRDDARATAQNSRTFALAGTVIAFFTMIAAVVTVVIAFNQ